MKLISGGIYKDPTGRLYLVTLPKDYNDNSGNLANNYFLSLDDSELKCGGVSGIEELSHYAEVERWELVAEMGTIFRSVLSYDGGVE